MASIPQWQCEVRRKFPRVAFDTVVELETPGFVAFGKSENISLGGMLVRCECAFLPGSPVLIAFTPPGWERMQIPCRVVHCRPGVRVGVQFVELQESARLFLSKFAQPANSAARRSPRFPIRFIVELRWIQGGEIAGTTAETVVVSRHGCLVLTDAKLEAGDSVALFWPEVARTVQARVVSRKECTGDSPRVALEFITLDDFWNPASTPATADPPKELPFLGSARERT